MKNTTYLLLPLFVMAAQSAYADTFVREKTVEVADWSDVSTWTNTSGEAVENIPTAADNARVWYNTTTVTQPDAAINNLSLTGDNSHGTLEVSEGGILTVQHLYTSGGTVNVFDGGSIVATDVKLENGSINIDNASFKASNFNLGSSSGSFVATNGSTLTMVGGTTLIGASFEILDGSSFVTTTGTVAIDGSSFKIEDSSVWMDGSFSVSKGSLSISNSAVSKNNGMTASGGTLEIVDSDVNLGKTTLSGADVNWSGITAYVKSSLTVSGGNVNVEQSDITTSGDFAVDGGSTTIGELSSLTLGGNYTQSAGSFTLLSGDNNKLNSANISGGVFNVGADAVVSVDTLVSGDNAAEGLGATTINFYGSSATTARKNGNGFMFGRYAKNQDLTVNIYDDATLDGRFILGAGHTDVDSSAATSKITANIYGNAVLTSDYVNLDKNATLNIYGNASVSASGGARLGDMSLNGNSAAHTNIYGNASFSAGGVSCIFKGAEVVASEEAKLTFNTLRVGRDWGDNLTVGSLALKDSATLQTNANLILYGGSVFEIQGSNVTTNLFALGVSGDAGKMNGLVRFVADSDGISTLVTRYMAQVDSTLGTSYNLELDFSKLALEAYATQTYTVITSSDGKSYIDAYLAHSDDVIKVIKANEADSFEFSVSGNSLYITYVNAVPEPSTFAFIFGALALGFVAYRRKSK